MATLKIEEAEGRISRCCSLRGNLTQVVEIPSPRLKLLFYWNMIINDGDLFFLPLFQTLLSEYSCTNTIIEFQICIYTDMLSVTSLVTITFFYVLCAVSLINFGNFLTSITNFFQNVNNFSFGNISAFT